MPAQIPSHLLDQVDPVHRDLLRPVIENVEQLTGQRTGLDPIAALPSGAQLADVIRKINEIIQRLQQ